MFSFFLMGSQTDCENHDRGFPGFFMAIFFGYVNGRDCFFLHTR